jgi:rhodanese-related sulfurtransferase
MGFFDLFKSSSSSNDGLKQIINEGAFLVDVRSPAEFSSGSAKGAVNIPLNTINSKLKLFKGKSNIVVFCRSGNRSGQAKAILERNGIKNVTNGGTVNKVNSLLN